MATAAPAPQLSAEGSVPARTRMTAAIAAGTATSSASGARKTVFSTARTTVQGAVDDHQHEVAGPGAAQAAPLGQRGLGHVGRAQQGDDGEGEDRPRDREQHAERDRADQGGEADQAEPGDRGRLRPAGRCRCRRRLVPGSWAAPATAAAGPRGRPGGRSRPAAAGRPCRRRPAPAIGTRQSAGRYAGTAVWRRAGAQRVPAPPVARAVVSVAPFTPDAAHRLTSERAVGRDGGSAERAAVTSGSSCGGTPPSSALPSMIRKKTVWKSPVPYGGRPVAA